VKGALSAATEHFEGAKAVVEVWLAPLMAATNSPTNPTKEGFEQASRPQSITLLANRDSY